MRLKHWTHNFGHYGIIVTSYRWMITELFGENRVHSALCYNYWYLNLAGNNSSCLTMPLCLAAIWAGTGRRFYWSGMSEDVKEWLGQYIPCVKRKSPVGRHHPLGNIPTGHRWDHIAMNILDVCDLTQDGYRYILVIADYFSKWTETFPMKNKCADTVADLLVDNIILRFGIPLVIHNDQGREFENGLMKSLCTLLGCTKKIGRLLITRSRMA